MKATKTIWRDGELIDWDQATVHLLAPAVQYGLTVFEGIRCYATPHGPAVFRLREHLHRLIGSAHILGVREMPYTLEDIRQAVHQTIRANDLRECYVRPLISLAHGPLGTNLDKASPSVVVAVVEWGTLLGEEALERGIRAMVSSFTRLHANVAMTKAKICGNYVNSVLAKTLALRAGFEEAILLDPNGFVAECTGENIFVVRDGALLTPPSSTGALEGITQRSVARLAADLGLPVRMQNLLRSDLYTADEVFLCGTAAEVVPVRSVDNRETGGPGAVTRKIQDAFAAAVHGRDERYRGWLTLVA